MTRIPKFALIALATVALAHGTASATTSRIQALGGNGAFFEDDANVLRWYGSLVDYPDLAVVETGAFNPYWGYNNQDMDLVSGPGGGVHVGLGQGDGRGTAALYFHGRNRDTLFSSFARCGLDYAVTALYSRRFGAVAATILFRHGAASELQTLTDDSDDPVFYLDGDHAQTEIGAGIRMDLSPTAYLDLAGEVVRTRIREQSIIEDGAFPEEERESWNSVRIRSRVFMRLGDVAALVPVAEFCRTDTPLPASFIFPPPTQKEHVVRLGCGLDYFPDTDRFLYSSLEYIGGSSDLFLGPEDDRLFTQSWAWHSALSHLGMETRLLAWMTLRASVTWEYRHFAEEWEDGEHAAGSPEDWDSDGFLLYSNLGAGLHLGRCDLDLALTNRFPEWQAGYLGRDRFRDDEHWITATLRAAF